MFEDLGRRNLLKRAGLALMAGTVAPVSMLDAQKSGAKAFAKAEDCNCVLAEDGTPLDTGISELRPVIERYSVELRDLERVYVLPGSPARQATLQKFYESQLRLELYERTIVLLRYIPNIRSKALTAVFL